MKRKRIINLIESFGIMILFGFLFIIYSIHGWNTPRGLISNQVNLVTRNIILKNIFGFGSFLFIGGLISMLFCLFKYKITEEEFEVKPFSKRQMITILSISMVFGLIISFLFNIFIIIFFGGIQ